MRYEQPKRRSSVAYRVTAGLLALTFLTVAAAGVALYGVGRFRQGFDRIATERVANLVSVARLAQQAQAIAVTAPRLAATVDRFERERAMRHLDDLFRQLAGLFDGLRGIDPEGGAVLALTRYREEIVDNLGRLDGLVADRHAAEGRLRDRLRTVDVVGRDGRRTVGALYHGVEEPSTEAADGADRPSLPGPDEVRAWITAFDDAVSTALVAGAAGSVGDLDRLDATFHAALAQAHAVLDRLPVPAATRLRPYAERLTGLVDGGDGVLGTRRALLDGQRQTQGALNRIAILSGQFVAAASNLFADARDAIEADRAEFAGLMDNGAHMLAAVVLVSLAASGLVFADLRRRVVARLVDLQRCMRARADGQPVPIPAAGNDELADMAGAFAFFVGEVEGREAELRAAKDAAERTLDDLRRAQEQLVATEKLAALGGLVAGVAHEINTPVGVALTGASFALERADALHAQMRAGTLKRSEFERLLGQIRETCDHVVVNIDRAASLIQSFKQVAADQTSGDRRRFRLGEYVGAIVASLEPRLRSAGAQVEVTCADDFEIDNYPGVLSQVLTNLIMNSLVHGFGDTPGGTVRIAIRREDAGREGTGQVDIRVSDDGRGMSSEIQQRVFDPFFTTRRGRGGTGLGLHIVHNLVSKSLGGRIAVDSAPGAGTTFSLRFPADAPATAEPATTEPASA